MSMPRARFKVVWGSVEYRGTKNWTKVGYAWEGKDGAIHAEVGAFPLNGRICIKDGYDEALESALAMEEVLG